MLIYIINFLILYVCIYIFYSKQENILPRAFIIAISLVLLALVAQHFGIIASIMALVLGILIIMKVMGYDFGGAFLLLVVLGILQQVIITALQIVIK